MIKLGNKTLGNDFPTADELVYFFYDSFEREERKKLHWEIDEVSLPHVAKLRDGTGAYFYCFPYDMTKPYLLGIPVNRGGQ